MTSLPLPSERPFRPPPFWREHRWTLLLIVWIVVFGLGLFGAWHYGLEFDTEATGWERFFDALYLALQLFTLGATFPFEGPPPGWALQIARLLAPAVAAWTLYQTAKLIFEEQWQQWLVRRSEGHVVVCGLGRKGLRLALRLRENGDRVVVIERDDDNPFRELCRERGIVVLTGDATDPRSLYRAGIRGARALVGLCGDDGANLEAVIRAERMVAYRSTGTLSCLVHVADARLCHLMQELALRLTRDGVLRVGLWNVYDRAALVMLEAFPPFDDVAESGSPAPRVLLVGSGPLTRSVVVHMARLWEELRGEGEARVRLTMVDAGAARDAELLKRRYPDLDTRCELKAVAADVRSGEFLAGDFLPDDAGFTRAFVLIDDDRLALATAFELHRMLSGRRPLPRIAVTYRGSLLDSVRRAGVGVEALDAVDPFSPLDRTMQPELLFGDNRERLARSIHESFRIERRRKGEEHPALVPWEELPEDLRESNRRQADHLETKIRQLDRRIVPRTDWDAALCRLTPEEVEKLAEDEHRRYVAERLAAGWTHGPERDYERKTNPTLVPWDTLPESEKDKDREAVRQIPRLLAKVGLELTESSSKASASRP